MKIEFSVIKRIDKGKVFYTILDRFLENDSIAIVIIPHYSSETNVVLQILSDKSKTKFTTATTWVKQLSDIKPTEYRKISKFINAFVEMNK
jgi:hypothetical protein